MFDVSVDMHVAAAPEGTLTTHIIEITPKKLIAKLMSPLIRLGLGKQTREAAANLDGFTAGRDPQSVFGGPGVSTTLSELRWFRQSPR